ncbi:1343_t:CDS:2, partial [Entrophospora sp. SA101]
IDKNNNTDESVEQNVKSLKSKFEQLTQQPQSNDVRKPTSDARATFQNLVTLAHQQHKKTDQPQQEKSLMSDTTNSYSNIEKDNIKLDEIKQKPSFKNAHTVTNQLDSGKKTPPPIPAHRSKPLNNYSTTTKGIILNNPFDDSDDVDPFGDDQEISKLNLKSHYSNAKEITPPPTKPFQTSTINDEDNENDSYLKKSPNSNLSKPYPDKRPPLPTRPQLASHVNNDDIKNGKKTSRNIRAGKSEPNHDHDTDDDSVVDIAISELDAPDIAHANRRPPRFPGIKDIQHKSTIRTFAIAGNFVITDSSLSRVWSLDEGTNINTISHEDSKVISMCWRPSRRVEDVGRYLWCGSQDGYLFAIDINKEKYIEINKKAHNHPIIFILRHEFQLWTIDDNGKLMIWSEDGNGCLTLKSTPKPCRITPKQTSAIIVGHCLWSSNGRVIEIFNPFDEVDSSSKKIELEAEIGSIKCMTQTSNPSLIYIGHEDGKISVWNIRTYNKISTIIVSVYSITSLLGVGDYLWAGFKTGMIYIYDVTKSPWIVIKDWQAHKSPVIDMQLDETSLWRVNRLQVASLSSEGQITSWDADEMCSFQPEYCTYRKVKVLICSWNIDASKPEDLEQSTDSTKFLRLWLTSVNSPDIIVIGFQEIIDLESRKMTAKSMILTAKKSEKKLNEHITQRYKLWHDKLEKIVREYTSNGNLYEIISSENLVGLFTCIFAKKSEVKSIRDIDVTIRKTGLKGLHGNKGSIATRFIYEDSSICFVNCHLAAGQSQITARNTDAANILDNTEFPSRTNIAWKENEGVFTHGGDGSTILDHEICFFSGDLNYRIDLPREKVFEAIENEDYVRLFKHDQLNKQMNNNPGFRLRSFQEAKPNFAPTYKYDSGEDEYDTSEKKRTPAWCDRILHKGQGVKQLHYHRYECRVSDHRPISGAFEITIKTILENKQADIREAVDKAWKVKVNEEKTKKMIKWLVECGWEEKMAKKVLKDNYGNLKKALETLKEKTK